MMTRYKFHSLLHNFDLVQNTELNICYLQQIPSRYFLFSDFSDYSYLLAFQALQRCRSVPSSKDLGTMLPHVGNNIVQYGPYGATSLKEVKIPVPDYVALRGHIV